jgi:uncharacterized protein
VQINVNRIPSEGLTLEEEINPAVLELELALVKFRGPLKAKAEVSLITNTVTIDLALKATLVLCCSRCLEEFCLDFAKKLALNYIVDKSSPIIDLDEVIREEIILDCAIRPLCKPDCKGLCPKCGKNLNQGGCSCAITEKKTF